MRWTRSRSAIARKKVNWVLDADIRGFFDAIDHGWLVKFVEHRIADARVLRLIQKWLSAGVLEEGAWTAREEGTPQGATVSPLLANIYLHYVLDLWVQQWRTADARGDVVVVRYADDFVVGFEHEAMPTRFSSELRERLRTFGLELHPDKTRLIEFGRFAADRATEARRRASRDLRLPRLHAHLREDEGGQVPAAPAHRRSGCGRSCSAMRDELRRATAPARPGTGRWLGERGARVLRVLRGADQQPRLRRVPHRGHPSTGTGASAPQPARSHSPGGG